ncbi:MAG: hypothetical protein IPK26_15805 [Planctomycetes bacterium]|nr:hypothetical protein [Planctomycetota bacterium]
MPTSHATWSCGARAVIVWLGAVGVGLLVSASVPAQAATPPAAGNAPATPPATANPSAGPTENAPAAKPAADALGTVLVDTVAVRVWPTANSPHFDEVLRRGQVVGVGRTQAGFRQVLLPLGPPGFLSKKYASESTAGKVRTVGKAVSFRYRPKSGEAAVALLEEGVELPVIGESDEWWRVRHAAIEAWVPEAEVQVFDQPPETMKLAFAELRKVHEAEAGAWQAKVAAAQEAARQETANRQVVGELEARFAAELKKPLGTQQLEPIATALTEIAGKLPADSALLPTLQALQKRVKNQQWAVDATALRDAEPMPAIDITTPGPKEVADGLERFAAIGWLRHEKPLGGIGRYLIEQGGQTLFVVACSSGRYDLQVFVGREVGLIGPKRSPSGQELRILDVEKIEVLGARR